jgi:type I restriction enzyme R subunit
VVVDYIGLAEEVQKAVQDPTPGAKDGKGGGFVTDISLLVSEFRDSFTGVEDLLASVDDLDLDVLGQDVGYTVKR